MAPKDGEYVSRPIPVGMTGNGDWAYRVPLSRDPVSQPGSFDCHSERSEESKMVGILTLFAIGAL